MTATRIAVHPAGADPYEVVVGEGVRAELAGLLAGCTRVLIVHASILTTIAAEVAGALRETGIEVTLHALPDGEDAKTVVAAERCWNVLGAAGATRDDAIVGLGGGTVTDLAGFVAATWLRGVRVVQLPSTVAAMVDAAIGGKTGINTAAGKNLVGAFHQPAAVLCDLDLLLTLPPADVAAGLAEVVKGGFIADPEILRLMSPDPLSHKHLRELIERKIAVKAAIVSADPNETGRREILNYGHTLGHAIERRENYRWRHGDAVSVGLIYAAELGRLTGRLDDATADRHRTLLAALGLPTSYDADAFDDLRRIMALDKKTRGHTLRFVVLDGLARPVIIDGPDEALLARAYEAVARPHAPEGAT